MQAQLHILLPGGENKQIYQSTIKPNAFYFKNKSDPYILAFQKCLRIWEFLFTKKKSDYFNQYKDTLD